MRQVLYEGWGKLNRMKIKKEHIRRMGKTKLYEKQEGAYKGFL